MRYDEAIEKVLPKMKSVEGVLSIFLKGSIARGENDAFSDLDLYVMIGKDITVESVYCDIVRALEEYQSLIFYEKVEIICPQIVGVYENMLHVDCYIVHEDNYLKTDAIKVLYDPENRMASYQKENLSLTPELLSEAAIDSCWFIFQYDHIGERGQHLWTTKMINNALEFTIKLLLHKYYPEKAVLGKKAAHHLPTDIYEELIAINDLIHSETHAESVKRYMILYNSHVLPIAMNAWSGGMENVYRYLYEKYAL